MIISFWDLNKYSFALTDISVLYQEPAYRRFNTPSRRHNGFLYILRGECVYECDGVTIPLSAGSLIYLPSGSKHSMTVVGDDIAFYRIDFNVIIDGELAHFSTSPLKITDSVNSRFKNKLAGLSEECRFENNTISKTEKLAGMLSALIEHPSELYKSKIGPAVKYIHEHFTDEIDCSSLASLCFLSRAQMYNIFNFTLGMAPLEYRDKLLLHQAKVLLLANDYSVSEISDALGFSSVAYFSRFFKKHTGKSPSAYIKEGEV